MNTINDYLDPNKYKKSLLEAFRNIFAGTIKESFLISMFNRIESDQRYVNVLMNKIKSSPLFSIEASAMGKNHLQTSICKMIVMAHYMNVVDLTDDERGKKQNNDFYKNDLTNVVINMYFLENLAAIHFSNASLETYLPIIYYASAMNNYLGNKYDEINQSKQVANIKYDNSFNMMLLYKLLMKIRACISLVDVATVDELMIVYRSLIELFMTYMVLWDAKKEILEKYCYLDNVSFNYNNGQEIPLEVKEFAKKIGSKDIIKFINYGWLYFLDDYKKIYGDEAHFSLSTIANILDKKHNGDNPRFGSDLYMAYRACNPQTHGTTLIMNFLDLELHIFRNISIMLEHLSTIMSKELFSFDTNYMGIDLFELLNKEIKRTLEVIEWLHKDDKNLIKTNNDYKIRYLCGLKMRN